MAVSASTVIVSILLALTVIVELLAVTGLVAMRTTMQRVHFIAPATCVGPVLAGIAVAVGTHATPSLGAKGIVVALVLVLFSGVLSHETALAAISRERSR